MSHKYLWTLFFKTGNLSKKFLLPTHIISLKDCPYNPKKYNETQKYEFSNSLMKWENLEVQPKLTLKNPNIPSLSEDGKNCEVRPAQN